MENQVNDPSTLIKFKKTTSEDDDFKTLVKLLDEDLEIRDGKEDHIFYAQYNKINMIRHALVYYENGTAIACGAFKEFEQDSVEIKRMYVKPAFRGRKIGAFILSKLEEWAKELKYTHCVLETGKNNPEAMHLYQREGYTIIPNYGQYKGVDNSVCFSKRLNQPS